jgi:hypothetical protein
LKRGRSLGIIADNRPADWVLALWSQVGGDDNAGGRIRRGIGGKADRRQRLLGQDGEQPKQATLLTSLTFCRLWLSDPKHQNRPSAWEP